MNFELDKSDWVPVKLGEIVTKKEENDRENAQKRFDRFLKVEHMDAGSLHIKRWSSQEQGDEINPTFYKIFRAGQILFPTRNPHLRRTALASFDGICGEKTLTLEPNKEMVCAEFIPFLFHSEAFYTHTTSSIIGSTNPHCRWRDVADYEFLLPPKEQQAMIAELLWAMDEVVERDQNTSNLSRTLIESFRKTHFEEMTPDGSLIGNIADVRAGVGFPLRFQGKKNCEYNFYKVADMNSEGNKRYLRLAKNTVSKDDLASLKAKPHPAGTIVFPKVGAAIATEKKRILEEESVIDNNTMGVTLTDSSISPVYLHEFFENMSISSIANSGTVPSINATVIKGIPFCKPSSDTLKAFVDKIEVLYENAESAEHKHISSKSLQKSLINQVF